MNRLREIYNYREMIFSMVRKDLRGRYQRSVLGILWTMLNPMFQIIVYTVIFTFIFPSNIPQYYLYLMTGLIPWTFFSESMNEGASAIIANADLTRKIYFPRDVLVISTVTCKFVSFLLSMVVVFLFLLFSPLRLSPLHLLALPFIMILEYMICLGFALFFSGITVYFRDMQYIVGVILMAWIWGTPIMYDPANIGNPVLLFLINLNPMTGIIMSYRKILYYHEFPTVRLLWVSITAAVLVLVLGEMIFIKLEENFAEEL